MVYNEKKYTVDGTKVAALYLLMIFKKCEVGTAASVAVLRAKSQDLPKSMRENGNNIVDFHSDIQSTITN